MTGCLKNDALKKRNRIKWPIDRAYRRGYIHKTVLITGDIRRDKDMFYMARFRGKAPV